MARTFDRKGAVVLVSTGLVLLTWVVLSVGLVLIGMPLVTARQQIPRSAPVALWWGAVASTLVVATLNVLAPVHGWSLVVVVLALGASACIGLGRFQVWRFNRIGFSKPDGSRLLWLLVVVATLMALSLACLGMPTNYDTGLYHLNSIAYAHDFQTIPGLANLHDRLGFNASIYPLAAALGNGFWSGQGFRVVTGFFLVAMAADATLRVLQSDRRCKTGTVVMVVGTVLILGYALQEPGRLVASPVADVMAAVLTVVATAYLLDALGPDGDMMSGATAFVVACLAATARPLGWVFAGLVALVLVARFRRGVVDSFGIRAAVVGGALLVVMLVRDVILSGWLFYPLGLFPMPVDWRVPDPTATREAITAWGRAPNMPVEVASDWGAWFPSWISSLPRDWAIVSLVLLLLACVALAVGFLTRRKALPAIARMQWLALAPLSVTALLWFVTAPDPRFAWGLVIGLGLVPFALLISVSPRLYFWLPVVGAFALICSLALTWVRGGFVPVLKDTRMVPVAVGPWTLTLELAPVKEVPARTVRIADGSTVIEPAEGLQCWSLFPLCRVPGSDPNIERRGPNIADGFRPAS